jgi:hypothetical protein
MTKNIDEWINSKIDLYEKPATVGSMVESEDFEDWLTIKVMVTQVETQYLEELYSLQMRLNHLLHIKLGNHNNPFGPYVICHTFKDVFDPFDISPKPEKVIYRVFGDGLIQHMGEFYQALNALFIKENVLPKLNFRAPLKSAAK